MLYYWNKRDCDVTWTDRITGLAVTCKTRQSIISIHSYR